MIYLLIVESLSYDLRTQNLNNQLTLLKVHPLINANLLNMDGSMLHLLLFFFLDQNLKTFSTNLLLKDQLH